MAKNDLILLDNLIANRAANSIPSTRKDEVFEYLAYQQILKDYDLSHDELMAGSVDGHNDGGIDAIYIFVNGNLVSDLDTMYWPRSSAELEIFIFTCKHADSFKQEPINNLYTSIQELLDFSLENTDLKGHYNSDVLGKRNDFLSVYKKIGSIIRIFNLRIIYACRGTTSEIGDNIMARGRQTEHLCQTYFSSCNVQFQFWGNSELLAAFRKKQDYKLDLVFQRSMSHGEQYVLLAKLLDYYKFITTAEGKLRKYIFDSNVRAFMGINSVNEDILDTLESNTSADFWWLNNGITILGTGALITGNTISIENTQIVNGLQTSECIHRYFSENRKPDNREILIKVLISTDAHMHDQIIRATNNQTSVESSALRATDKVQQDIEEILKKADFFYERRTNYYKIQGASIERIISPLYLASGYIALIKKAPHKAVSLKNKFMRNPKQYDLIFSEKTDLNVWVKIASIMKACDLYLEKVRPEQGEHLESYKKSLRYIVALITVARILQTFDYSIPALAAFDLSLFSETEIEITWKSLQPFVQERWDKSKWRNSAYVYDVLSKIASSTQLAGIESVTKRHESNASNYSQKQYDISEPFLQSVLNLLPVQPWPVGIHKQVANELRCANAKVWQAIDMLIEREIVYAQRKGVLFDKEGNEVSPKST